MESPGPVGLAKFILPKLPGILFAAATNVTGFSENARVWDLRTAIGVNVLRQMLADQSRQPLSAMQAETQRDSGPKGKLWTAPATIPATKAGDGVRDAVFTAIAELGATHDYVRPESADLPVEWTGYRPGAASATEPLPQGLSDRERYDRLMAEPSRTGGTTILYFHGGAYYLCSFATHRDIVSRLAKACNGRALAVGYRLAPQAAFPSQLIDALHAYLYLLYPPEGSLHEPVAPSDVVIAGDSAGGHISFGLLQLILHLHRTNKSPGSDPTVQFHGKKVAVPLPAGVATFSAWLDVSLSSPSWYSNAKCDYLPQPLPAGEEHHTPDDIWPTKPRRGHVFCDLEFLDHPLVALHTADWTGAPPLFMSIGDELLYDENSLLANRARKLGIPVQWEHYEGMPHCFAQLMLHLETGKSNVRNMGRFMSDCVHGKVKPKAEFVHAKTGKVDTIELADEAKITFDQAVENLNESKRDKLEAFNRGHPSEPPV